MESETKQTVAGGLMAAGVCIIWLALLPVSNFIVNLFCDGGCDGSLLASFMKIVLPGCVIVPALSFIDGATRKQS